jgi:hypothetical protein
MSKYHIIPATGEPGKCSATIRCPFGEEDHFGSKREARKFFEEKMSAEQIPSVLLDTNRLQDTALTTKKLSEMNVIVKHGSDIALRRLAQNKRVTPELLVAAWEKSDARQTRLAIAMNPKTPASVLNQYTMESILDDYGIDTLTEKLKSNEVTDAQAEVIARIPEGESIASVILENHNNQITHEAIKKLAMRTARSLDAALKNPKFDSQAALSDKTIPTADLDKIARQQPSKSSEYFVYNHPNTSKSIKDWLVERRPSGHFS